MIFKLKFFILFIILILFLGKAVSKENKILFKINNEIITTMDVFNEINYLKATNEEFRNTDSILSYEIAKNSIIKEKIKEIELKNLISEIEIEENVLNKIIQNNFKYLNIKSNSDFNEYFKNNNIKPLYVKKKISIELLWNQLIYTKYRNKIKIDVDELRNKLINEKRTEFNLSEILFELKKGEKIDEKYDLIKTTIDQKNFSRAALIHSISDTSENGGKIGWIRQSALNKKILKEINKIRIDDYTSPIVVPGGFLIIKVEDKRELKINIDLEQELKKVIDKAQNQQLSQYSIIYFNKIKKNISINEL